MTAAEAASSLRITVAGLAHYVYARRIRPEQAVGPHNSGVGPSGWTFTEAEVERFRAERDAGIDRKRAWNQCLPKSELRCA